MLKTDTSKNRDMGVELIRIAAMYLVVLLHLMVWGGTTKNADGVTLVAARIVASLSYCCVNLFALVSGYVSFGKKQRWERLTELWFQVFFYSVGGFVLYFLVTRNIYGGRVAIIRSFLPVSAREYWYFSSYFLLFCFRPLIDRVLESLDKLRFRVLLLSVLLLFCVISAFLDDSFATVSGYSPWWLMYMYAIGAYIKRYPEDFRRKRWLYLLAYFAFSALALPLDRLGKWTDELLGTSFFSNLMLQFDSIPILIASLCLFLALKGLSFRRGQLPVRILSIVSFDVYLIHVHRIPFACLKDRMAFLGKLPWYEMLALSVGIALCIYLVCAAIGWLRIGLFRLLRIGKLSKCLSDGIEKLLLRLCKEKRP